MDLLNNCIGRMCTVDLLNDEIASGVVKAVQDGWMEICEEKQTRYISLEYVLSVTIIEEESKKGKNLFRL